MKILIGHAFVFISKAEVHSYSQEILSIEEEKKNLLNFSANSKGSIMQAAKTNWIIISQVSIDWPDK